ncbi:hypothetical protein ACP70R_026911 [Stipagrostis hirtigluma subsp. patula]
MSSPADSRGGGGGVRMNMNMVTTVMAFSVSAFFVLFVFTRLLCARLHLRAAAAAEGHAGGDAFVVTDYNVERGISGLEPSVVRSFPTVKVGDGGTQRPPAQEESQCTVCLEEYAAKDVVRVLPACGHAFHAACIDAWLRQHPTCPVCRASLRAPARNHHRLAAAAARAAPVPAPSSSTSPAAAERHHQTGMGTGRLEIVAEEPAPAAVELGAAAAAVAAGGGDHCGCCGGDTARPSASSSASEHC